MKTNGLILIIIALLVIAVQKIRIYLFEKKAKNGDIHIDEFEDIKETLVGYMSFWGLIFIASAIWIGAEYILELNIF